MFIYKTYFPYIGGEKIPLHYYSLLYRELDIIWRELVEFLEKNGVEYSSERRNLEVRVEERALADKVLAKLHSSFMMVEGFYDGEPVERNAYLVHLRDRYGREFSEHLMNMVEHIRNERYEEAFREAYSALENVASAENTYARTGRRLNQLLFEMLHGNIPQTYTNTYLLAKKGSSLVERIASQIYRSVAESAYRTALLLKTNYELMDKTLRKN